MTQTTPEHGLSRFTLGIGPLLLCGFAVPVSNSMIFPALSELQDEFGFSDAALGFIAAAGFLASLLVQLFVAPYADRGNPKRFVLGALLLAALGSVLFAVGNSLWFLILARAITGASLGTSAPTIRAIVANLDKSRAAERLGRLRGIELAGFTGGPLIGALLIGPFGLSGAFLVFGVVAVVAAMIVAPRQIPSLEPNPNAKRLSFELLRIRRLRAAVLASLTLFMPVGVYDSLWDVYITDKGGNNFMVGLTFLLFTIPFVLLGAAGGRLADRRGPAKMTLIGMFLTVPLVFVYGVLPAAWLLVAFAVIEGVVGALSTPAAQSLVAQSAPPGRATAAQGLAGSGELLAATLVSLIAPALYGTSEEHGGLIVFGAVAVVMTISASAVALMLRTTAEETADQSARN